ncbi:pilus assembly protein [Marinobacter sp. F3R08]|uniref:pilus assembly protein n=1 Tax=Marinobacter sp. F3R08 TaxID=2841559 RepID=UPI001C08DFC1|nr:PilC/PilY family type IV pilus protein [Marinobacter sp. F3R08]MBU2952350.1 hypothetical protein [Marinobacter sp. F3R08]
MFKQFKARVATLGMIMILPVSGWGDVNFSHKPLMAGGGVDPNLMFMLDDSGSMLWGYMPDGLIGQADFSGNCYSNSSYAGLNPYRCRISGNRFLASSYLNKVYYNPDIQYVPPLRADGTSMDTADFTNAAADGYSSSSARVNLSNNFRAIMDPYSYGGRGFTLTENGANAEAAFYYNFSGSGWCTSNPYNDGCYNKIVVGTAERENFANWFSYYRTREMAAKAGIGTVFANPDLSDQFRLGWGRINKGNGTVDDASGIRGVLEGVRPFEDVREDFIDWLYGENAGGSTPLLSALEGAGEYFRKSERAWLETPSQSKSTGNPARECRISATMLMTDGYYSTSSSARANLNEHADGSDGPVYTSDGNSAGYVAEAPYSDNFNSWVTLGDIAAYYWKNDLRPDIDNFVPTTDAVEDVNNDGTRETLADPAFWQHMMTFGIGFGVEGSVSRDEAISAALNGTPIDWWGGSSNEDKINDLLHASVNGRGDFFSAGDPATFQVELQDLLDRYLGMAGSASGVDFNVATIEADDALIFSSKFDPNGWSGELEARTVTKGSSGSPAEVEDSVAWSARAALDSLDPDERVVLTYNSDDGEGVAFRSESTFWGNLDTAQKSDLAVDADDAFAKKRLDYLRGKRKATFESENNGDGSLFRQRQHLLGTMVNSTPRFVGAPDSSWPNDSTIGDGLYTVFHNEKIDRTPVVYVGANDGMLHGFKATDYAEGGGSEVLAYVPSFISSTEEEEGLHYLTEPGYDHRFYVDLNLEVVDVYSKGRENGPADWRTVLIGGARAGAKGIFALDITNPDEFSEDNADELVLWEFTHPDLGYITEPPQVALMRWPDKKVRWTVFVPTGYNSGKTGFFMLDLEGGLDGKWSNSEVEYHSFESGGTGLSPLTLVDTDLETGEPDYLVDRVYAGDLDGNLWVAEIDVDGVVDTAHDGRAYFNTGGEPITSAPAVGLGGENSGTDPNLMILFGTGKYLESGDHGYTGDRHFYSVHEVTDVNYTLTKNDLLNVGWKNLGSGDRQINDGEDDRVDYQVDRGWYVELPTSGERVVNYPIIRGEYVYVNTLIPGSDPCLGGGDGWVLGFEIIRAKGSTPVYKAFANYESDVAGIHVDGGTPSQLATWGSLLTFGTSGGGAGFIELDPFDDVLGRKGWREITE